jgi:RNA polymerase sigma-70 factor (ECF subfamily)
MRRQDQMTEPMGRGLAEIEGLDLIGPEDRHASITSAYEAYHAELYNFLRRATRDEDAAEDLLQDTFLRLTREVDAGRLPEHVRGWLYRVASNLVVSRGRHKQTVMRWLTRNAHVDVALVSASPEADILLREQTSVLEAALARLPAETRAALLLSAEGFTGEEIATAIGRTHGATRTMLSRARVQVRHILEKVV